MSRPGGLSGGGLATLKLCARKGKKCCETRGRETHPRGIFQGETYGVTCFFEDQRSGTKGEGQKMV